MHVIMVTITERDTYPITELRMSNHKNNYLCHLPNHVIIHYVNTVLHDEVGANNAEEDNKIREKLDHALQKPVIYREAFQSIPICRPISTACDALNGRI